MNKDYYEIDCEPFIIKVYMVYFLCCHFIFIERKRIQIGINLSLFTAEVAEDQKKLQENL